MYNWENIFYNELYSKMIPSIGCLFGKKVFEIFFKNNFLKPNIGSGLWKNYQKFVVLTFSPECIRMNQNVCRMNCVFKVVYKKLSYKAKIDEIHFPLWGSTP